MEISLRRITATNTKVRRLGYLKQLIAIIGTNYVGDSWAIERLENWASDNKDALSRHIDDKGIIDKTLKHTSARRYIEVAPLLNLIVRIGGKWRVTKEGAVFLRLNHQVENPFQLTDEEACYFIQQIITMDADNVILLLELLEKLKRCKIHDLIKQFKEALWQRLTEKASVVRVTSDKIALNKAAERVQGWRRPEKYIEHIIPPRVNWLLDLKLIDWDTFRKDGSYRLSREGSILLNAFPQTKANGKTLRYVDRRWCENGIYEALSGIFFKEEITRDWKETEIKETKDLTLEYLTKCFDLFKTRQIPRIAASQFLRYACLKLLIERRIVCGYKNLKEMLRILSHSDETAYRFHWSIRDDDGFIIR